MICLVGMAAAALWSQVPGSQTPAAPPPARPADSAARQAPAGQPGSPAPAGRVYEFSAKPLAIDFPCTDEDIQWGGLSCSEEEPCPVYLEIAALETAGNRIFLAGNIHSETMTLYSVLLASEDGGRTWSEPFERLRGAGLDHIQFLNFENGWISGQILHPLPSDPFFLATSDGGRRWDRRPVFGESRVATILQFGFDSKSSGAVVIDNGPGGEGSRYEMYESRNGGESWMIREAGDRPLKLRRGASEGNPDWRIRADNTSKSFQVERRQGGKWQRVAAFLVQVGSCKPMPRKEIEAPAETPATEAAPAAPAPPRRPAPPPSLKRPRP